MERAARIFSLAAVGGIFVTCLRLSGKPYSPTWLTIEQFCMEMTVENKASLAAKNSASRLGVN